jgi:Na+-driven multidrug efflux pump
MAMVCALNITLNFLLVFHTHLSYRGIALATASSVCAGSLLNLPRVRAILLPGIRFSFSVVRKVALIGWPMGLLQVLWLLASMVIFFILSALPKNQVEVLAAFTAGLRIESAIYLPAFAFNLANAVVVGNFLGEKKPADAFRAGLVTAGIGVGVVSVLAVAVIAGARWIAPFLSDHPVVIQESVRYIYISMISEPFMAWGMILGGGLSGAGDTRSVLLRVGLSLWLIRIPLCYLAVIQLGLGPKWVWWSMNLSQMIQAIWIFKRYLSKEWL